MQPLVLLLKHGYTISHKKMQGGADMSEAKLVNRTRFTSSMKNELSAKFDILSEKTRITKSKLIDEAIEDLLKKYEKLLSESDQK